MDQLTKRFFPGLPIEFAFWEVLYVIVLFFLLVFVLDRYLLRPVNAVLAERERRIAEGRGAADDSEKEIGEREKKIVERLAKARSEAVARLEAAKSEAETTRQARVGEARARAEQRLAEALTAIQKSAGVAETQLKAESEQLGKRIASRFLGREVA